MIRPLSRCVQLSKRALLLVCLASLTACGAVYPELHTAVLPAPEGAQLDPPPPPDLLYLGFAGASIPKVTRDGRRWDAIGGSLPDPFAKVFLDNKEILRSTVQSNTLSPTWPDAKRGNFTIPRGKSLRVELWDDNPVNDHPICVHKVVGVHASAEDGGVEVRCDSGATLRLIVKPAQAKVGLGFSYELRTQNVFVTRVVRQSPAGRVGVRSGDQIVKIQGKEVRQMAEGEAKSLINANAQTGLTLTVKHAGGKVEDISLKQGPIYPLHDEPLPG